MDSLKLKSFLGKNYKEAEKEIMEDTDFYPRLVFLEKKDENPVIDKRINRIILEINNEIVVKVIKG